jgi:hypothetical protein
MRVNSQTLKRFYLGRRKKGSISRSKASKEKGLLAGARQAKKKGLLAGARQAKKKGY